MNASRLLQIDAPFLVFPVTNRYGAPVTAFRARDAATGELLRTFAMPLACGADAPDWLATFPVAGWLGRRVAFELPDQGDAAGADRAGALDGIRLSAEDIRDPALRHEPERPQFHFTTPRGWMNDPNGLAFADGEWRMFYQHCPFVRSDPWKASMFWGYAVSRDLVHWTDLGDAILPHPESRLLISGSGVVDAENTAGFGRGAHVVASVQDGLRLWHSEDGRSFAPCRENPVLEDADGTLGGDPKIFRHAPTGRWIMVTHGVHDGAFAVFIRSSENLRDWLLESIYYGDHVSKGRQHFLNECPGLEHLRIEGEDAFAWVMWCAGPEYAVGDFDGRVFTPFEERLMQLPTRSTPYYAQQSFSNAPDGRCVAIPWYRLDSGAATFSQAMGLPCDLTLRRTPAGLRLCRRPSPELSALRESGPLALEAFNGELAECRLECDVGSAAVVEWNLRGVALRYDAASEQLAVEGLESVHWPVGRDGRLALRVFVDRFGIEVFSCDGLLCMAWPEARPDPAVRTLSVARFTGAASPAFAAWRLRSIWLAPRESEDS